MLLPVLGKRLHEIIAEIVTAIEIALHGRIPLQFAPCLEAALAGSANGGPLSGQLDAIIA
jgi:hypothetical protein